MAAAALILPSLIRVPKLFLDVLLGLFPRIVQAAVVAVPKISPKFELSTSFIESLDSEFGTLLSLSVDSLEQLLNRVGQNVPTGNKSSVLPAPTSRAFAHFFEFLWTNAMRYVLSLSIDFCKYLKYKIYRSFSLFINSAILIFPQVIQMVLRSSRK